MQKNTYLKYFRKTDSTPKPTQSSFEQNQPPLEKQHQNLNNKFQFSNADSQILYHLSSDKLQPHESQQSSVNYNNSSLNNFIQKRKHIQTIRVHNHSSPVIKKSTQTKNKLQLTKILQNVHNESFRIKANATISESVKTNKLSTQSLHSPLKKKQGQTTYLRMRTLQSPSLYDPCLTQQKFFTQPIKPYDRNKTAPNKKFRTLKTTFGDLNSSCRNYNDQYTMSLQNLRMGWRIVNAKSMIQEYLNSTYFTYHLYNGNMINKQKMKTKDQKDKKRINFKQMKNVYKVFFNKNILFKNDEQKKPNLLQSIHRKDDFQEYILNQSQIKKHSRQGSICTRNDKILPENCPNSSGQRIDKKNTKGRGSHKPKPCFFRSTYRQHDRIFNTKICEKDKLSKLSKQKDGTEDSQVCKKKLDTEPNPIGSEDQTQHMNEIFGKGSTIIQLRNLLIESNPPLKNQDILVFQIMAKNGNISSKGISTPLMKYSEIKNGLKFAIDTKVGDLVPLKIWKYHGLNLIELGIIDLNLIVFRNRRKYFDMQNKIQNQNGSEGIQEIQFYRQQRKSVSSHQKKERQILFYHAKQRLRKNKKAEIEVTAIFNCLIYNKKFSKRKADQFDVSDKENLCVQTNLNSIDPQ